MPNLGKNKQDIKLEDNSLLRVGSICSGIEAASVAWKQLDFEFSWFSEIATFPSLLLETRYPSVSNVGDMTNIPNLLNDKAIDAPDVICGGTPCQAFSYAGWQQGLKDDRGNLTLKFVDIANANDEVRRANGEKPCIILWENVEGVLSDKTNAFGCFVSALAGLSQPLTPNCKWPSAGLIKGNKRVVAWRVLDAKYFGLPQQRRRLYVVAGAENLHPESILFETLKGVLEKEYPETSKEITFKKNGHNFEIFREYTDCLYASYATKWNGNAAANNGSLFVVQDGGIRRFSPLECERLMGFPDGYTELPGAKKSCRYQALGNSWAVPVIKWIGERISRHKFQAIFDLSFISNRFVESGYYDLSAGIIELCKGTVLNCGSKPGESKLGNLRDVVSHEKIPNIYLSPVGCAGILRRRTERGLKMNRRLERLLKLRASDMPEIEIEAQSRIQKRSERFKT